MIYSNWLAHHESPDKTAVIEIIRQGYQKPKYVGVAAFFIGGTKMTFSTKKFKTPKEAKSAVKNIVDGVQKMGIAEYVRSQRPEEEVC